jgi:hypothetical protein
VVTIYTSKLIQRKGVETRSGGYSASRSDRMNKMNGMLRSSASRVVNHPVNPVHPV